MRIQFTIFAASIVSGLAFPATASADIDLCLDQSSGGAACSAPSRTASPVDSWRASIEEMEELAGVYFALRGGYMHVDDLDLGAASKADFEVDDGYVASGAIGYQFSNIEPGFDLRLEVEVGYQQASIESAVINGADSSGSGEAGVVYGFFNAYGDYRIAPRFELFAGGGLGAGAVTVDYDGMSGVMALSDEELAFGYHLDAGISYQVTPDVALEAGYRFSSFLDAEVGSASGGASDVDLDSHQLLLGLRFKM